jgi:hypothetical protein
MIAEIAAGAKCATRIEGGRILFTKNITRFRALTGVPVPRCAVASSSAAAHCSALDFGPNFTPMKYLGIRYTIRARTEREQWHVAIHPAGVEMNGGWSSDHVETQNCGLAP